MMDQHWLTSDHWLGVSQPLKKAILLTDSAFCFQLDWLKIHLLQKVALSQPIRLELARSSAFY